MSQMNEPVPAEAAAGEPEEPKKKKRKKKKYTRGFKSLQKGEVAVSKGVSRLARAVDEGIWNWRKNRTKSSRKKRDGAIRDALKNYGKAMSKFNRVAAKIPQDITDGWPRLRRMFR